jgi:hypothetical protein
MSIWHTQAAYCHTSPFLHFEIPPDMSQHVLPSNYLQLTNINSQNISYKLKAIIYLGGFHFTARLIEENGKTWAYDSQINRGIADEDQNTIQNQTELTKLQNRQAYIYLYQFSSTEN